MLEKLQGNLEAGAVVFLLAAAEEAEHGAQAGNERMVKSALLPCSISFKNTSASSRSSWR